MTSPYPWDRGVTSSLHRKLYLRNHLLDRRGCSILHHRNDLRIETFIEDVSVVVVIVAVVDLVVVVVGVEVVMAVVVVEVELIVDHVHFGTYDRLNFGHQFLETIS